MVRGLMAVVLGATLLAGPVAAQSPLRFKWQAGQILLYSVRQTTSVIETTIEEGTSKPVTGLTVTKLTLARRWEVTAVDPTGAATLDMSITAIRQDINRPGPPDKDGKPTVDRASLDSSTAEGRQQTAVFLNKPILTVKVDTQGRLVEAKAAAGSTDRLRAELPFRLTLPDGPPAANATWDRTFPITLAPPLGTGEQYDATQTYTLKGEAAGVSIIGVDTALKASPKDPAELPALVPLLWEGEVYFDPATGRYAGAKLAVKKEVANHQGEGTKFAYESEYVEGPAGK